MSLAAAWLPINEAMSILKYFKKSSATTPPNEGLHGMLKK